MSLTNDRALSSIQGPYYGRADIGSTDAVTYMVNCLGCKKRVHVHNLALNKSDTSVCPECLKGGE